MLHRGGFFLRSPPHARAPDASADSIRLYIGTPPKSAPSLPAGFYERSFYRFTRAHGTSAALSLRGNVVRAYIQRLFFIDRGGASIGERIRVTVIRGVLLVVCRSEVGMEF